jgi:hypothetical protein
MERAEYLVFSKLKRYSALTPMEKEMLFCFSKLDIDDQEEIISYAKFKRSRK